MTNFTIEQLTNSGQYNQTQTGIALASSAAATDISPGGNAAGQAFSFPAGYLQAGQQYRVRVSGIVSNTGTPTLILGLYYGGVAGTALAASAAVTTSSGLSNSLWRSDLDFRVESVGTSGAIRTFGTVTGVTASPVTMPASSSSGNSVTVDTTVAKLLTFGATWGTPSSSNSIQVHLFGIERLNEGNG